MGWSLPVGCSPPVGCSGALPGEGALRAGAVPPPALVLTSIDGQMTLLVFALLLFMVVVAERAGTRIRRYRNAARQATEQITGALGEMYGAVQSIKLKRDHVSRREFFYRNGDHRDQEQLWYRPQSTADDIAQHTRHSKCPRLCHKWCMRLVAR